MSAAQMKIPKIKDLNTNNDRFNKSSGTCEAKHLSKGGCHLRFSGIRPLRGGGYPPFPLRKKTFFFSH